MLSFALRFGALAGVLLTVLAPGVAYAPPPPLARVPPGLNLQVDGYDLEGPYQRWRYWIEAQKGPVVKALVSEPETLPGETVIGGPLLSYQRMNELGVGLAGDLRVYCKKVEGWDAERETCHFRLREATVPVGAAAYGEENPVSRWIVQNFDPVKLASHLRRIGVSPNSDWWRVDRQALFAQMPSPEPVLRANAKVEVVDSRTCPQLAEQVLRLEQQTLEWRLDFRWVGRDTPTVPPPPHGVLSFYTLKIQLPGPAGEATIEGGGPRFADLVEPVISAAGECRPR